MHRASLIEEVTRTTDAFAMCRRDLLRLEGENGALSDNAAVIATLTDPDYRDAILGGTVDLHRRKLHVLLETLFRAPYHTAFLTYTQEGHDERALNKAWYNKIILVYHVDKQAGMLAAYTASHDIICGETCV